MKRIAAVRFIMTRSPKGVTILRMYTFRAHFQAKTVRITNPTMNDVKLAISSVSPMVLSGTFVYASRAVEIQKQAIAAREYNPALMDWSRICATNVRMHDIVAEVTNALLLVWICEASGGRLSSDANCA
jgi:hypothetical protein